MTALRSGSVALAWAALVALVACLAVGCSEQPPDRAPSSDGAVATKPAEPVEDRPTPAEWLHRHVEQRPIAFDAERKRQMAAYSLRHYGDSEWRLRAPKLIVIHFAVADTLDSIRSTFEGDAEHNGEPPNTCAHFAVDAEGEIIQMVDTAVRCRHVIGLNDVAIGIEHTGFSDEDVLGDREEMKASLGLVQALRCRYELPVSAVIGHNESPGSPYFHRDDPHAGLDVHSDFGEESMDEYRSRLKRAGPCARRFAEAGEAEPQPAGSQPAGS